MHSIMFGKNPAQHIIERLIDTVKHGGGGVTIWDCFAATGSGHLTVIELTTNSSLHQGILKSNVGPSA